jgi:hypothetical protein
MYGVVDWIQRRGGMLPPSAGVARGCGESSDTVLYRGLGEAFYAVKAAARPPHSILVVAGAVQDVNCVWQEMGYRFD